MHSSKPILPSEFMVRDEHASQQAMRQSKLSLKQKDRFFASAQEVQRRRESVPKFEYAENLPISSRMDEIERLIAKHQVVIVAGETGSGKTTQIPLACLRAGYGLHGMIGHTQPRRLAARTVADRIATQLGAAENIVGYAVRFSERLSQETLIKVMTDGLLLSEIRTDRYLRAYDAIVVDEAHERSFEHRFSAGLSS